MVAGSWKKLLVLTSLVTITTLLNYSNLSRSDLYLREVGPSKMSDRELLTTPWKEAETIITPARAPSDKHKRQKIPRNVLSNQTTTPLSSNRQPHNTDQPRTKDEAVGGYVLADDYWEQQNSGCRNLQNLQCWAAKLNMKVVEPFIVNSVLRTLPTTARAGWLRYSTMFNVERWNRESARLNHSELVSWEEFLAKAHHTVITVELKYAHSKDVQRKQNELKAQPLQHTDTKCEPHTGWPRSSQIALLKLHNFTIARKVCLNFEYGKFLTLNEFRDVILGDYSPSEVTIIIRQWRGLAGIAGRIPVKMSGCGNTGIQENMQPSQRLFNDATKYALTYLTSNHSKYVTPLSSSLQSRDPGNGYIAIMARLEKSKLSFNKRPGIVPYCFRQTLKYTRRMAEDRSLGRIFLSIDIGKFGSNTFKNTGDSSDLHEEFEKFFKKLYGGQTTIHDWEKTFQEISHTNDSGYIALLQKMVVVQAKCVIFVGGGSFQKHALNLYKSAHPKDKWCIHIIKECTTDKNLPMDSN